MVLNWTPDHLRLAFSLASHGENRSNASTRYLLSNEGDIHIKAIVHYIPRGFIVLDLPVTGREQGAKSVRA